MYFSLGKLKQERWAIQLSGMADGLAKAPL